MKAGEILTEPEPGQPRGRRLSCSGYRIFEETIRIDSSAYFLRLRLNFFVALVITIAGLAWFFVVQWRAARAGQETAQRESPASTGQQLRPGSG